MSLTINQKLEEIARPAGGVVGVGLQGWTRARGDQRAAMEANAVGACCCGIALRSAFLAKPPEGFIGRRVGRSAFLGKAVGFTT